MQTQHFHKVKSFYKWITGNGQMAKFNEQVSDLNFKELTIRMIKS